MSALEQAEQAIIMAIKNLHGHPIPLRVFNVLKKAKKPTCSRYC